MIGKSSVTKDLLDSLSHLEPAITRMDEVKSELDKLAAMNE